MCQPGTGRLVGHAKFSRASPARYSLIGASVRESVSQSSCGNGHDAQSSCVKWDGRAGRWLAVAPMHARRHYFAAAFAADGQLYAAGGFEWSGQLASAEVYDARADRWRPASWA